MVAQSDFQQQERLSYIHDLDDDMDLEMEMETATKAHTKGGSLAKASIPSTLLLGRDGGGNNLGKSEYVGRDHCFFNCLHA